MIKNSQPFGKKFQKTVGGGDFFLTHTVHQPTNVKAATCPAQLLTDVYLWCYTLSVVHASNDDDKFSVTVNSGVQ